MRVERLSLIQNIYHFLGIALVLLLICYPFLSVAGDGDKVGSGAGGVFVSSSAFVNVHRILAPLAKIKTSALKKSPTWSKPFREEYFRQLQFYTDNASIMIRKIGRPLVDIKSLGYNQSYYTLRLITSFHITQPNSAIFIYVYNNDESFFTDVRMTNLLCFELYELTVEALSRNNQEPINADRTALYVDDHHLYFQKISRELITRPFHDLRLLESALNKILQYVHQFEGKWPPEFHQKLVGSIQYYMRTKVQNIRLVPGTVIDLEDSAFRADDMSFLTQAAFTLKYPKSPIYFDQTQIGDEITFMKNLLHEILHNVIEKYDTESHELVANLAEYVVNYNYWGQLRDADLGQWFSVTQDLIQELGEKAISDLNEMKFSPNGTYKIE